MILVKNEIVGSLYHPFYRDFNGQNRLVYIGDKVEVFRTYFECKKYIDTVLKPAIERELNVKTYTKRLPFWRFGFIRKPIIYYNKMPSRERQVDLSAMLNTLAVGKR